MNKQCMPIKLKQMCIKIKSSLSQISSKKLIFPQNLEAGHALSPRAKILSPGAKKSKVTPFLGRNFAKGKNCFALDKKKNRHYTFPIF
jgi:hypothetical protein